MSGNVLTLDSLVGWLTAFELRNYDNSMVKIGNAFKSSLNIGSFKKEKKRKEKKKVNMNLRMIQMNLKHFLQEGC